MTDIWGAIHAERRALADDLADLTAEQWRTPSLCAGWTVQDVLAHQVGTACMNPPQFIGKMIGAGFNFARFADKEVAKQSAGGPAATLERFREATDRTSAPPGPKVTWLGEAIVHSEDIRRPLGIKREYPRDAVLQVLDFYRNSNAIIGTKRRIAGLTLKATDVEWSHGSGPLVEGPALSLLLAATGRKAALDDLSGPGVETLRSR
ncbi:MAG: maleylpyruvate isomerase family mycothiol-dependent enzyme [Mycobacteriales bacterium]